MRLLISIIKFEQGWGGAPESVRLLARSLASLGIVCDVVTNRGFRSDIAMFDLLPPAASETQQLPHGALSDYDAFLIAGPWQPYGRMHRLVSGLPASTPIFYLPRGGLAMAEFRRPRDIKKFPYLALLERRLLARSERIVFSSTIEDHGTRLIGRQAGKRIVIPDIVEPVSNKAGMIGRTTSAPIVATFMAEAAPRKGLLCLLEAFDIALRRGKVPSGVLLNIGGNIRPGSEVYVERCRALAANLPIEVRFLGGVAHGDRAALYATTDLFLTPSSFESFGLTVIEALSAGCRLLTAPRLGVLEFLPESDAVTIAHDATPDALAAGLAVAFAARPAKVGDAEATATRQLCKTAVAAINDRALGQWQSLLSR